MICPSCKGKKKLPIFNWVCETCKGEGKIEHIACAAIWFKNAKFAYHGPTNITSGVVLCGYHHSQIIHQSNVLTNTRIYQMQPYIQGFLTSENRFVGREEGYFIALKAKQVKQNNDTTLFSEMLWHS